MSAQSKLENFAGAREKAMPDTPARRRISMLVDPDSFVELDGFVSVGDGGSGVVCGYGSVMGSPVYVFAQDSTEEAGAVGALHAAKIAKVYDLALKTGVPVVGIYDSMGARVSEGVGALSAYGEILLRANNLSGVVPQLALVLGTCAGTSAMLACCADFVIMSEAGEFFLNPPGKSQEAAGAGSAAYAAKSGVAQLVCGGDQEACEAARKLLCALPLNNLASPPVSDFAEPAAAAGISALCASVDTADVRDIAAAICDEGSAIELLADFGANAYTAVATMAGLACGVVATRPGLLDADSSAKIAKIVSVCDSFQIPVITLVNTAGFGGSDGTLCASVRDMARLAHVYAEATTPKIAVITGEAYGAAYVALCSRTANADYTIAWPSATISPLVPQTAVAFLYGDRITKDKSREEVEAEYRDVDASPIVAAKTGAIDDVIDPALTRPAILSALDLLSAKRVTRNPKKHSNLPL